MINITSDSKNEMEHLNSSPFILIKWRAVDEWPVNFVSENITRFGYNVKDFTTGYLNYTDIIHSEDRDKVKSAVFEYCRNEAESFSLRYRIVSGSGQFHLIEKRAHVMYDSYGSITGIQGIITEIMPGDTEISDTRYKRKEEPFEFLSDHIDTQVWYLQEENKYGAVNRAHADFIGFPKRELEYRYIDEIENMIGPASTDFIKGSNRLFSSKIRVKTQNWVQNKRGEYRLLSITKSPKLDENGSLECIVCSADDITDQKKAEIALKKRDDFKNIVLEIMAKSFISDNERTYKLFQEALSQIGMFLRADRCYIYMLSDSGAFLNNTNEWFAEGVDSQIKSLQNIPLSSVRNFWGHLTTFKEVSLPDTGELPHDAIGEQEYIKLQKIKSLLWLPITIKNQVAGVLGIDSVYMPRKWNREEVTDLRLVADIISGIMVHRISDKQLKKSEERIRGILESQKDFIFRINTNGDLTYVNDAMCKILASKRKNLLGQKITSIIYEKDRNKLIQELERIYILPHRTEIEHRIKTIYGLRWFEGECYAIRNENNEIVEIQAVTRDITNKKLSERALKLYAKELEKSNKIKQEMEEVVNSSPVVIFKWIMENGRHIKFVSDNIEQFGYTADEFISGKVRFNDIIHPDDLQDSCRRIKECIDENQTGYTTEYRVFTKDKKTRWIVEKTFMRYDQKKSATYLQGIIFDITDRKKLSEARKKEILLKEVHHRVKNNLQVIASLLNLQSRNFNDKQIQAAFRDSQSRVRSMALAHEELYESKDLATIDIADYIKNLTNYLLSLYSLNKNIDISINADNAYLNVDTTVPLGLILNELASNSLKYAFPDGNGLISIVFNNYIDEYQLEVHDNGVGLPEYIDFKNTKSLGLKLVNMLVEQISGTIELDRTEGTKYVIRFKEI